jgi:DNA modification methylase
MLRSETNIDVKADQILNFVTTGLKPAARNARTHSKKQINQIAASIRRFGFLTPILIDKDSVVVAGHGRLEAAKQLGMETVPCLYVGDLSKAELRALAIADNKLALNAGWDEELLALELNEIKLLDVDFDLEITGFSIAEADGLIEGLAPEETGNPKDDVLPDLDPHQPVTRAGDVWVMGNHRLVCGDAQDKGLIAALMAGGLARMVFTDPPYNVPIAGHVSGLGAAQHREFVMASGEMSKEEFTRFLTTTCSFLAENCLDGAIVYICMDWRHMDELSAAGHQAFSELKNLIVWSKDNGGMGSFYRSRHELIFCYKVGTAPHLNSFELGQHGRYRTNVWNYKGMNSFGGNRNAEIELHPTVKPVQMIADAIKDVSKRGDIVLDLFGGSGSTLIAAHKTGRRGYLCEIDPVYCDRIIRRWQRIAKDDAVLEDSGMTFDETAKARATGPMDQVTE